MWKDIPGFPGYQASTNGRIKSLPRNVKRSGHWMTLRGAILKPIPEYHSSGRLMRVFVNLCVEGKSRPIRIHALILLTFVGPRPAGLEACHADGDCTNNRIENLRWDNDKSNQADSKLHGTKRAPPMFCGEAHPRSKLSYAAVNEIRSKPKTKGRFKALAVKFGVHPLTISRVYHGRAWLTSKSNH